MKDGSKTKAQLIEELAGLRQRISELEALAADRNDIEQALRESERKLLTLMSNLPGFAYRCLNDANWTMEFISDECFELTGYKSSDLIGNRVLSYKELIHGEDRDRVWNEVQVAVREKKPFRLVYRISTSTGEQKWVWEQGTAVYHPEGDLIALEGFVEDISEQKLVEERLRHLNLVLRAMRNVNQLIVREKDVDKLIKGACDKLVATRSYHNAWIALMDESVGLMKTAEAGLDEAFLPMVEQLKYGGPPDCGQKALKQSGVLVFDDPHASCTDCPLSRMYEGRAAMVTRLEHYDRVFGILTVSIPAEFAYDQEEQALFQEVGNDVALALHNIELAEQTKRSEEELRQRTRDLGERLKELNCLYGISKLTERQDISWEDIFQGIVNLIPLAWRYPEITCTRIILEGQEFTTADFKETIWKQASDITMHGKRIGTLEIYYLEERPKADEGPFLNEERSLIDAIAERLGRIKERKQAEEALRNSEKFAAVGKLAAGVAHSVRNPLTSVKMRLFSMERSLDFSDTQKEDFEVISQEIRNIDNIIRNFLAFSRPPKLKMQKASPSNVVDTTLGLLSQRLDSYEVEVIVNRERRLAEILLDSEQLEEVLVNLIINSCEAIGGGGQIVIDERLEVGKSLGQELTVRVSDNGPGVPESVQNRLFEPFFSTKDEGTGLGLSIAARIVEEHGGSLRLDPTKEGGATFIITLPIKEESSWATS